MKTLIRGALALAFAYALVFVLLGLGGCAPPHRAYEPQEPDLRAETIKLLTEMNRIAMERARQGLGGGGYQAPRTSCIANGSYVICN